MTRLVVMLFVAGGVGTLLRFSIGRFVAAQAGASFPWGTLAVNCLGSLACGIVYGWMQSRDASVEARMVVLVGFLGALTTFSTFALESVVLAGEGRVSAAIANVAVTNVLGLSCLAVGLWCARVLFAAEVG